MALATSRFLPVLDCPDPRGLAAFYRDLLGWQVTQDSDDWVELSRDGYLALAFQLAPQFVPRAWPAEGVHSHIDVFVDDLDDAEREALRLGALRVDHPPTPQKFRVYRDPAGHHFCLCTT
ncbi:VOC family protein [Rhodococcus chondri]|uniref:VOC family protein n=1 Tax=Rhodococcus chondri TaxID=3065941 RepID=A0ABU7JMH7_9NOCA|nr:VOC family protein [Rhodococcus sp. CC-R104]MEE2031236.1 VOC family protein [Rhodococcus sp. CC-R104]